MTSDEYLPDEEYHAEIGAQLERTIRATQREFGVGSDDQIDAAIIIDLLRVAGSHLTGDAGRELFAWADHVDAVNIGGRPLPRGIARPTVEDPAEPDSAPNATPGDVERPWCGAPREFGGQQPCPIKVPCDERTCRIGSAVGSETYRSATDSGSSPGGGRG